MPKKVTIYTRVYNTEKYLRKCLDSVANQTFTNFQHIVVNNGCTDGCTQMLKEYAEKYPWVKLITFEKNGNVSINEFLEYLDTPYFCQLDSDDWLEPDFLERMVSITESENADIVATGSVFHVEADGSESPRKLKEKLIMSSDDFAEYYPQYHAIFRTVWAKLYKTELYIAARERSKSFPPYGCDTAITFSALRKAKRVCIDDSILHHYIIRKSSTSYKYDPKRSDSDLLLYNDALDFLSAYGPISDRNLEFINIVYANAITDTVNVIDKCNLSATEKLSELRKIIDRKETTKAYAVDHPHVKKSKGLMLVQALKCGHILPDESEDFRVVVDSLLPSCGKTVRKNTIELFALDNSLLNTLATDDRDEYLKHLLSVIAENKYTKKFDFGKIVATLAHDKPILNTIDDVKFIRKHQDIYLGMWNEKYLDTLHAMTDYLLSGEKNDETFLTLYLNLSAALEKVDEFIFGKTKIASLYFSHKQFDKCREILNDLTDMGVEDTEEIAAIRQKLN